jgi:hypothetical protein
MKFDKSYRLLNYLNDKHNAFGRFVFASFAYTFVLMASRSFVLAKLSWNDFVLDDFKLAFRRLAWFGRQATAWLSFLNDHFFDFTERSNIAQCNALERLICSKVKLQNNRLQACDLLYVAAQKIHLNIDCADGEKFVAGDVVFFYQICTASLKALTITNQAAKPIKKQRDADFSKDDAILALQDFARLLPIDIWKWYVISGTFLGLYREGGFLAHDYDVDIGIDGYDLDVDAVKNALALDQNFVIKKINYIVKL